MDRSNGIAGSAPRRHRRDRYRDERRGIAGRSRFILAMARRLCLRHQRRLARRRRDPRDLYSDAPSRQRQFRSRPGLPLAQGPDRGRRALRHHERSLRLGLAAHRRRRPDATIRTARRGRRARGHGRREPAQVQPRRHLPTPRLARQGHRAAGGSVQGGRLQDQQEDSNPILHLATAGAPSRPLRRDRRGANARSVRNSQADRRAGRDARRLSARGRPAADGA